MVRKLRRWTSNHLMRSTKAGLLLLRILHRRGNQTYVVLAKDSKVMCWFYAFERSMLTDKSKEDRLRRWTLKRFSVIFLRTKLDLWVDFSLSFTLVISQFIQGNVQLIFFYYFIQRYFDYFIIILPFFCLTVVTVWTIG